MLRKKRKRKKAFESNKKNIVEIKEKGLDNVKINLTNLKNIVHYHFRDACYKDTKLQKKDFVEIVRELTKNANARSETDAENVDVAPKDVILDLYMLLDGETSNDDGNDDVNIVEGV